mmetsp:Transcript_21664/g.34979  ORF Transcript_21664/g.34979 Transcript_21664/m.34979 type:complete len:184 (+) Transcript_21664:1426-1977(+)
MAAPDATAAKAGGALKRSTLSIAKDDKVLIDIARLLFFQKGVGLEDRPSSVALDVAPVETPEEVNTFFLRNDGFSVFIPKRWRRCTSGCGFVTASVWRVLRGNDNDALPRPPASLRDEGEDENGVDENRDLAFATFRTGCPRDRDSVRAHAAVASDLCIRVSKYFLDYPKSRGLCEALLRGLA